MGHNWHHVEGLEFPRERRNRNLVPALKSGYVSMYAPKAGEVEQTLDLSEVAKCPYSFHNKHC